MFPLDDRYIERLQSGEPSAAQRRAHVLHLLRRRTTRITEGMAPNMKNTSYSITANGHDAGRRRERHPDDPGRLLRRQRAVPARRQADLRYAASHYPEHKYQVQAPAELAPGKHTSRWISPTTAVASARAARRRCSSTASKWHRAASTGPSRSASPPTRRSTSARTPARRSNRDYDVPFTLHRGTAQAGRRAPARGRPRGAETAGLTRGLAQWYDHPQTRESSDEVSASTRPRCGPSPR